MRLVMNFAASKHSTMVIVLHPMSANVVDPEENGLMTAPCTMVGIIAEAQT